jgi:apolipoprotein D and lipocalin family protein
MKPLTASGVTALAFLLSACQSQPAMKTVESVDLQRFMGDWYVIANIPTVLERDAYNAVENYRLDDDGSIATTFTFQKGGFDGSPKKYTPRGFVREDSGNALWGMQFVWPVKADYRIVWLDEEYSLTVIGRQQRDYVWIMARQPEVAKSTYREVVEFVESIGYDISKLRKVPQQWPAS